MREYSLSSEQLHAQQGKDEDEEEEKEQETEDGTHAAQQRDDEVPQIGPVPARDNKLQSIPKVTKKLFCS